MTDRNDARRALESIAQTRRETARSAASPRGDYVLVGLGVATIIAGVPGGGMLRWSLYAAGLACILIAMAWYRRHTRTMTLATFREPGAWMAWLLIGISTTGAIVALLGNLQAIIAAAATGVAWAIIGPRWDAAWVRSIEEQR